MSRRLSVAALLGSLLSSGTALAGGGWWESAPPQVQAWLLEGWPGVAAFLGLVG